MKKRYILLSCLILVAFIFAIGCAGPKPITGTEGEPEWIRKGSGAFPEDTGTAIYGVGVSTPSPNPMVERSRADERARAELAKVMNTYIASLIKDFMEEHKDYMDPESSGSQEFYSYVGKSVTDATLVGSQIIDHWKDKDKNLWSLGKITVSDILATIKEKTSDAIREQKSNILKAKANEAMEELNKELDKLK